MTPEEQQALGQRTAEIECALVWLAHWFPHTYEARAMQQGFPAAVEPAALARHEAATAMQVELLEEAV